MLSTLKTVAFSALVILQSTIAQADELKISAPALPPQFNGDGSGREADIIRETLKACGHKVKFNIFSFGRHIKEYDEKPDYDAVATHFAPETSKGYPSEIYIYYQNGASYLKSSNLQVRKLEDLKGKKAITFFGGVNILGLNKYKDIFASIRENGKQIIHSNLLFAKRVDVVLSDGMIFAEYNNQLKKKDKLSFDPNQPVKFAAIFSPSPYRMVFRKKETRDQFNKCFAKLNTAGKIRSITASYVERYKDVLGDQYLGKK